MKYSGILAAALTLAATQISAQDTGKAVLVLDGSGSMWGQIDGVAKITIAQEVVGQLLATLPDTQALGLTVYGHRRKGDCTDIETIVTPGQNSRDAIAAAVNGVKPKGKTPMTEAIRQAAEALRYTEEKATVILVSDGIETCDPDPCAAARALEEAGVDFTAHVIGFDVTEAEALRQMQCLADETGGTFRTASNAAELGEALAVVTEPAPPPPPKPEPAPEPVRVTFSATDGRNGPVISDGLVWSLFSGETPVFADQAGGTLAQELVRGEYRVTVLRNIDGASAEEVFGVGRVNKDVKIALPLYSPPATLEAADSTPAGSTIPVRWTGPDGKRDYISVGQPGDRNHLKYTYTEEGPLLDLLMPPEPGRYEIRYVLAEGGKVLATRPITLTPVAATVTPPETAQAGGTLDVSWVGPDYARDYIALSRPGERDQAFYTYTEEGSPLKLRVPSEPGSYEVRYVMANGSIVLATSPLEVLAAGATLTPPGEMPAGGTVKIAWTGPDNPRDFIAVTKPGEEKSQIRYAYTEKGSPLDLQMPPEAGPYDLVYVSASDHTVIERVPITVTPVGATITPPAETPAGGTIKVTWTGPDFNRDYISVVRRGEESGHLKYTYTGEGSPLELTLPGAAGEYDLVYVLGNGSKVIDRVPITVVPVSATLSAPDELAVSAEVPIEWTGPDFRRDFIAVTKPGEERSQIRYSYTSEGSPLMLKMPDAPGTYDLVYVLASDHTIIARVPITVK